MGLWRAGIIFLSKGLYRSNLKGWPRANIRGLWWPGIKFLSGGMYRNNLKGQPRADIKGRPMADIKSLCRDSIKFQRSNNIGLVRAGIRY